MGNISSDRQFYIDLAKIQEQYDFKSQGYGGISIYDTAEDGKRVAGVNWSAPGTVNTKKARAFAEALLAAIEACEQFNRTHDMDDI